MRLFYKNILCFIHVYAAKHLQTNIFKFASHLFAFYSYFKIFLDVFFIQLTRQQQTGIYTQIHKQVFVKICKYFWLSF